jgi:hypothetical protein
MQQGLYLEENLSVVSPEFLHVLWSLKVHHRIQNSSPLHPILNQISAI